ncbi:30S ribosomal protein S4 [Thermoproteota archaeon]
MGDPRKTRKKYQTPEHPWNSERIETEKVLKKEYALKNKTEIWKMEYVIRKAKEQAKKLSRTRTDQARMEESALLTKLQALGILAAESSLDTILALDVKDVLERRLQTKVFKQMLANSMRQARQYIIHGHITVDGKAITSPSYIVSLKEEGLIGFQPRSSLADPEHPERVAAKKETPEEIALKAKAKDSAKQEKKKVKEEKPAEKPKKEKKKAEDKKEEKPAEEKKEENPAEEKKEEPPAKS